MTASRCVLICATLREDGVRVASSSAPLFTDGACLALYNGFRHWNHLRRVTFEERETAAESWALEALGASDRAEAWREMLAQAYIPFDARPDVGAVDDFDARVPG